MTDKILTSTPMRPAESNELPRFSVPAGSWDTHMHVFGPLEQYPSVAHPHYTKPDGTLAQYRRLREFLGLTRFVIVQPSFYGTDNRCLLHALGSSNGTASGVVMVERDISQSELERFDTLGVRAIRLDLFKIADSPLTEIRSYILEMAAKATALNWHLQFYAPGRVVRELIDFLSELRVNFVIDHMGYMLEEEGLTEKDFARLLNLTRGGYCWLKLSGPYRIAKERGYAAVQHIAQSIVEAAPDRSVWGSDWPHIPDGNRDTGELINLLLHWAPREEVRRKVLVDNPARLFGFV